MAKKPAARPGVRPAAPSDAPELAALHTAVAVQLTREHGRGHWSNCTTEKGVLWALRISRVFLLRQRGNVSATFALQKKKPWAIDVSYFTPVETPLDLVNLAVDPRAQGRALGRRMVSAAIAAAKAWPADAIR
ncbi:MAG: hypothetical protein ABW056_10925, partial [Thermoanaerobaculia bacterium]